MRASLVALIPRPVLGGVGITLFGTIAASGVQTLSRASLEHGDNVLVVAVSLGAGITRATAEGAGGGAASGRPDRGALDDEVAVEGGSAVTSGREAARICRRNRSARFYEQLLDLA